MSDNLETTAVDLGVHAAETAVETLAADAPGWAHQLHDRITQEIARAEQNHKWLEAIVTDLQRYGVPLFHAAAHQLGVPAPAETAVPAETVPAADTTAAPAAEAPAETAPAQ